MSRPAFGSSKCFLTFRREQPEHPLLSGMPLPLKRHLLKVSMYISAFSKTTPDSKGCQIVVVVPGSTGRAFRDCCSSCLPDSCPGYSLASDYSLALDYSLVFDFAPVPSPLMHPWFPPSECVLFPLVLIKIL